MGVRTTIGSGFGFKIDPEDWKALNERNEDAWFELRPACYKGETNGPVVVMDGGECDSPVMAIVTDSLAVFQDRDCSFEGFPRFIPLNSDEIEGWKQVLVDFCVELGLPVPEDADFGFCIGLDIS